MRDLIAAWTMRPQPVRLTNLFGHSARRQPLSRVQSAPEGLWTIPSSADDATLFMTLRAEAGRSNELDEPIRDSWHLAEASSLEPCLMPRDVARLVIDTALAIPLIENMHTRGYAISFVVKRLADAPGATKSATAGFSLMEVNFSSVDSHIRSIEWLRACFIFQFLDLDMHHIGLR